MTLSNMKNKTFILIICLALLFLTACKSDEQPESEAVVDTAP